jgi:hypothetical protein
MVLVLGRNRPIERGLLVEQRRQIVTTSHPSNISEPWPGRNLGKAALPDGPGAIRSSAESPRFAAFGRCSLCSPGPSVDVVGGRARLGCERNGRVPSWKSRSRRVVGVRYPGQPSADHPQPRSTTVRTR